MRLKQKQVQIETSTLNLSLSSLWSVNSVESKSFLDSILLFISFSVGFIWREALCLNLYKFTYKCKCYVNVSQAHCLPPSWFLNFFPYLLHTSVSDHQTKLPHSGLTSTETFLSPRVSSKLWQEVSSTNGETWNRSKPSQWEEWPTYQNYSKHTPMTHPQCWEGYF